MTSRESSVVSFPSRSGRASLPVSEDFEASHALPYGAHRMQQHDQSDHQEQQGLPRQDRAKVEHEPRDVVDHWAPAQEEHESSLPRQARAEVDEQGSFVQRPAGALARQDRAKVEFIPNEDPQDYNPQASNTSLPRQDRAKVEYIPNNDMQEYNPQTSHTSLPRQARARTNSPSIHDRACPKAVEATDADSETNFRPKTIRFWMVMLGLYLAVFVVALDRTIISVAIPEITDDFDSLDDVGWYGSAYMITGASFSLVFGKVYKHYSIKWVFLGSIVVFEVGSAVCGAAPNSIALIIGRAIAGLGSSGIFTGGMMVIVPLIPLRKRPIFYGLFGAVFGVASVLGPFLGGSFTQSLSWRWCFYINLPLGGFTLLSIVLFLHITPQKAKSVSLVQHLLRLDPIGSVIFIPSIVCLVLALQWGGTTYAWNSATVIGLLVGFGALFILFWIVQIVLPRTATVPIRIVTQRSVLGGVIFLFLLNGSLFIIVYLLPIWFQAVKGDSPIHSGVSMFPLVLGLVVMSILAGGFTQRVGYYMPPILISPILTTVGAALLYELTPTSNHTKWIGYQVLYGFGTGMAMQTTNMAAQTVLPRSEISTGMALNFFGQNLGGAIFVPVAQNIFQNFLAQRLTGIPGIDVMKVANSGILDLRSLVPATSLPAVEDAFNYSITRALLVSVGLSAGTLLAALIMEWKNIKEGAEVQAMQKDSEKQTLQQQRRGMLLEKATAPKSLRSESSSEQYQPYRSQ